MIEHAIDELWFVALEEGPRHLDVFADNDAGRHVWQFDQFESRRAQDGTNDRVDACQAPAGRKLLIDQRVDLTLSLYHSAQHLGKVFLIGIGHAVAIGAAA